MQKRMHHEVMIDAQTLYSVVKAAYPEVTHPQLVVTESDVSYRLCDGYITPNLDLRLRGQCGGGAVDLSLVDGNAWERLDSEVFVESLLDYLIKKGHLTPEQYTFLDVTPEMADWKDQVLPERPDLYVLSVPVPDINQATWLTMVVGLKREEQNPAVPVVLLCEALATKEQAIDHALRILEEHFAYHEVYRMSC